VEEEEDGVVL
jgi:hypothetical protein